LSCSPLIKNILTRCQNSFIIQIDTMSE
jgi:hypothetical protein